MLKTLGLCGRHRVNHTRFAAAATPRSPWIAGFRRGDGVGRADMHPQAFQPQAEQPSGGGGAVEQRR